MIVLLGRLYTLRLTRRVNCMLQRRHGRHLFGGEGGGVGEGEVEAEGLDDEKVIPLAVPDIQTDPVVDPIILATNGDGRSLDKATLAWVMSLSVAAVAFFLAMSGEETTSVAGPEIEVLLLLLVLLVAVVPMLVLICSLKLVAWTQLMFFVLLLWLLLLLC